VLVDKFHPLLQVLLCSEWECSVIDVEASHNFLSGQFFGSEHGWCVAAYSSVG
jgi:hypothetical protein